jgi:hypothetical protein
MTEAAIGYGSILYRDGHAIAEVRNIEPPSEDTDIVEATHYLSPDRTKEFLPALMDPGELSFEANFIPGDTNGQAALRADRISGAVVPFELEFPIAGATLSFDAFVKTLQLSDPIGDVISFNCTLKVTGVPVLTYSASAGLTTPFFDVADNGLDTATIVPTPSGTVYEYVVTFDTTATEFTITPTAAVGTITIISSLGSQVVATGNPSTAIPLGAAGSLVDCTIKVAEAGKSAKEYTLHCVREAA